MPKEWEQVSLIPTLKSREEAECSNYRRMSSQYRMKFYLDTNQSIADIQIYAQLNFTYKNVLFLVSLCYNADKIYSEE